MKEAVSGEAALWSYTCVCVLFVPLFAACFPFFCCSNFVFSLSSLQFHCPSCFSAAIRFGLSRAVKRYLNCKSFISRHITNPRITLTFKSTTFSYHFYYTLKKRETACALGDFLGSVSLVRGFQYQVVDVAIEDSEAANSTQHNTSPYWLLYRGCIHKFQNNCRCKRKARTILGSTSQH